MKGEFKVVSYNNISFHILIGGGSGIGNNNNNSGIGSSVGSTNINTVMSPSRTLPSQRSSTITGQHGNLSSNRRSSSSSSDLFQNRLRLLIASSSISDSNKDIQLISRDFGLGTATIGTPSTKLKSKENCNDKYDLNKYLSPKRINNNKEVCEI